MSQRRQKLIIDTDAGTDDAQAILMAIAHSHLVEIVAITTVFGNGAVQNVTNNVRRVLNLCAETRVPVYEGCTSTLLGRPGESEFHGKDGLGDVPHLYPAGDVKVCEEHAASAMIRLAKEHPGEITLVTCGPLTNAATALKLDPTFGKNLKAVSIMGGSTIARGNITVCAEFNIWSDPEAAQCVFNHLNAPITLVHKDVCEEFSFSWEWYEQLCNLPTEKAKFVRTVEKVKVKNETVRRDSKYTCYDQLATAVAIDNSIVKETQDVYATVELGGTYTRGQVIVDPRGMLGKPTNIKLLMDIDKDKYENMLFAAVGVQDNSQLHESQ